MKTQTLEQLTISHPSSDKETVIAAHQIICCQNLVKVIARIQSSSTFLIVEGLQLTLSFAAHALQGRKPT